MNAMPMSGQPWLGVAASLFLIARAAGLG